MGPATCFSFKGVIRMADEKNDRINPPPPISTPKEAPWREIEEIISLLKALILSVNNYTIVISEAFGIVPGESGQPAAAAPGTLTALFPLLQREKWAHGHLDIPTPGTALPLPDQKIPPGFDLVVRAKKGNTGDIYTGNSKARATRDTDRITLDAGQAIKLRESNANVVFVDAEIANEGVEWFVEI
jgi:hypothetical protein